MMMTCIRIIRSAKIVINIIIIIIIMIFTIDWSIELVNQ